LGEGLGASVGFEGLSQILEVTFEYEIQKLAKDSLTMKHECFHLKGSQNNLTSKPAS
jgi:hypothetical protein